MYKATVIVCDTEVETRTLLAEVLEDKLHYRVIALARASDIINCLYENHTSLPEVVLLDVSTQDVAIGKAQEELQLRFPHLPVLALTHYGDMKQASEALARGAMDYLARPVSHQRLKVTVDNAVRQHRLAVEVSRLRREMTMGIDLDFLPADNPRLRRLMPRDVSAESRIILYGEQGVGKEALARAIHTHTARPGSPFVSVSCAPLAEIQVWGTLFGSADCKEEGGDDSQESPCGQLAAARGGTLLLNDVEALSHTVQARLAERLSYLNQQPASRQNMTDQSVRLMVATTLSISELKQSDRLSPDM